jgi:hypothetical protein
MHPLVESANAIVCSVRRQNIVKLDLSTFREYEKDKFTNTVHVLSEKAQKLPFQ